MRTRLIAVKSGADLPSALIRFKARRSQAPTLRFMAMKPHTGPGPQRDRHEGR